MKKKCFFLFALMAGVIFEGLAQDEQVQIQTLGLDTTKNEVHSYYIKVTEAFNVSRVDLPIASTADNTFLFRGTWKELKSVIDSDGVSFVQRADRKPRVESIIRQHDLEVNGIALVQALYPDLNGAGFSVSVKENTYREDDFDIAGRAEVDQFSSPVVELHATEMATLIAGSGNTYKTGQGVAGETQLYAADFANLMPEALSYYQQREITVQNHSYGVGIENFYGVESSAYDNLVLSDPALVHSFSIGNRGTLTGGGRYSGIEGYGTITGSFKQAKNILLSSSLDTLGGISDLNSRGPAYDGRIKPDLVAFGGEGTSESAALISGCSVLLQELYFKKNGTLPHSDLVKASLIAGADDMLQKGPDFISGYGKVNLYNAIKLLDSEQLLQDTLTSNEQKSFTLSIPENTKHIRIALVWNDLPAEEGSDVALVNDLDLTVVSGSQVYSPWILNSEPSLKALEQPATRGQDHLNNVELITVKNPAEELVLNIEAFAVAESQSFAIAYHIEEEDFFQFSAPNSGSKIDVTQRQNIRWNTNVNSGDFEVQYDGATSWQMIEAQASLGKEFSAFRFSPSFQKAQLRLVTSDSIYYSDIFSLSQPVSLQVDLNCNDNLILKWNNVNAASYQVSELVEGKLQVIGETTDTLLSVDRSQYPGPLFRVDPKGETGQPLLTSFLTNIDQQNVGCYIKSFLINRGDEGLFLRIDLDGVSEVASVQLLKSKNARPFELFQNLPAQAEYEIFDRETGDGVTSYRLVLTTKDALIFEEELEVLYTASKPIVFPTIVSEGFFNLVSPFSGNAIRIYDAKGALVFYQKNLSEVAFLDTNGLTQGLVHYVIFDEFDHPIDQGKLLIR